jgi:hypothetical protein
MVPSLGRIGLFRGKMVTLCGRVTNVPTIIHGTSTKEEFEVIRFIENNTPFPLLFRTTWIKKDQIRRKAEVEATENKKQELRDFIARKIDRLIEEREVKSEQHKAKELSIEVERMQEGLKDLSTQEIRIPTLELIRKEALPSNPSREHQHREATMLREYKNIDGKRNPEYQIIGKKARKLRKKKSKLEKL